MAITGKFAADFASFYDAVQKAEVSLTSMESGGAKVEAQINRVANSLEGGKIVQQATIAAAAVESIGGISKLTENELAKIGATATEAAAKLKAMGQDVPPGIQAIADASAAAAKGSDDMGHSWVLRVAEGMLLRDAIREVITVVKEMVGLLPELAMKGSVVGDIEQSFQHLTAQVNLSGDALMGTLRTATHGTVDDFQLMQRTNKDLAAGLNLTDAQFGTLAQGAFALAKATGGTTTEALSTMSDAMITGRAKAVALLTGKIDLKAAEESYAASLGGTADQLTAEQKIEADRIAILGGVEKGLARVGEQHDSLKDKVEQGKVAWANFEDEVGKQIAQSPVIAAGFDTLRTSLAAAFGGDQKALIQAIGHAVDDMAVTVVDFGIAAVAGVGVAVKAFEGLQGAVFASASGLVGLDMIQHGQFSDGVKFMAAGVAEATRRVEDAITGHTKLQEQLVKVGGALFNTRDAMLAASGATQHATDSTAAFVGPIEKVTQSLRINKAEAKAYADAIANLAAVGTTWQKTLEGVNPGLVEDAKQMLAAGANAKDLEVAWGLLPPILKAIELSMKDDAEAIKTMSAQEAELTKASAEHYKAVNAASHNTVQAQIDDAYLAAGARIAAMEKTKSYSVAAEMEIWAAAEQTANNIVKKSIEANANSKDAYEARAATAEAAYANMIAHADRFKTADIEAMRKTAEAARIAADNWTTDTDAAFDHMKKKSDDTSAAIVGGFHQIEMASQAAALGSKAAFDAAQAAIYISQGMSQNAADQKVQEDNYIKGSQVNISGHRAAGGPVSAGAAYLVGENGPELFVPHGGGDIIPNGQTFGGTGSAIDKQVADYQNADAMAQHFSQATKATMAVAAQAGISIAEIATLFGTSSVIVQAAINQGNASYQDYVKSVDQANAATKALNDIFTSAAKNISEEGGARSAVEHLSAAQKDYIATAQKAGVSVNDLSQMMGLSTHAIALYETDMQKAATDTKAFEDAQKAAVTSLQSLKTQWADTDFASASSAAIAALGTGGKGIVDKSASLKDQLRQAEQQANEKDLQDQLTALQSASVAGGQWAIDHAAAVADLQSRIKAAQTQRQADDLASANAKEIDGLGLTTKAYQSSYEASTAALQEQLANQRQDYEAQRSDEIAKLGPGAVTDAVNTKYDMLEARAKSSVAAQIAALGPIPEAYASAYDQAFDLVEARYAVMLQSMGIPSGSIQSFLSIPGRAAGGPVSAGAPYMVGENGPELFVPASSGGIVPHGSGGGITVVNNIYVTQPFGTADAIGDAIMQRQLSMGMRFGASA